MGELHRERMKVETISQWRERIARERRKITDSYNLEEIDENHAVIRHEWMESVKLVDFRYIQYGDTLPRLYLRVGDDDVMLTDGETGYFMAWIASWYDRGGE